MKEKNKIVIKLLDEENCSLDMEGDVNKLTDMLCSAMASLMRDLVREDKIEDYMKSVIDCVLHKYAEEE